MAIEKEEELVIFFSSGILKHFTKCYGTWQIILGFIFTAAF